MSQIKPLGSELHDVSLSGWDEGVFNFVYEHQDVTAEEIASTFTIDTNRVEGIIERLRRRITAVRRNGRAPDGSWRYRVNPSELEDKTEDSP